MSWVMVIRPKHDHDYFTGAVILYWGIDGLMLMMKGFMGRPCTVLQVLSVGYCFYLEYIQSGVCYSDNRYLPL